jgi:hypothetical protein
LGANDGILSTSSLALGVAAAHATHRNILVAGVAGLVAGAMSMAAGEYVSVHSQADTEQADLKLERAELKADHKGDHKELQAIYIERRVRRGHGRTTTRRLSGESPVNEGDPTSTQRVGASTASSRSPEHLVPEDPTQAATCALRKYHTNLDRARTMQGRGGEIQVWRGVIMPALPEVSIAVNVLSRLKILMLWPAGRPIGRQTCSESHMMACEFCSRANRLSGQNLDGEIMSIKIGGNLTHPS